MKDYRRRRTGVTRTQAGTATINGSTFGNHIRIIQGNLNIFRSGKNTGFSSDNESSETVQAQLEEKEKTDCLRSLVFRDIDARLHDISPVQPGTCEWIFEMLLFQKWYDHSEPDNGLLWIKGNPGTGKSTLTKHIFQYCQAKEEYVIAAYFFNARGTKLEQTPLGMLRSLLFQLLKNMPCLYDQLLPMFRKKGQEYVSDDWEWREPELKSFCLSEIPKCQPGPLLLIIDALDECSEADVQNVAEFLQDLRNNAADAGLTLKICLSSRHYPFIRFKAYQELVLEKEKQHEEDIIKYISSNLTHKDEKIEESIRKRSSGIFMWVVLVISMLNKAYEDGKIEGMKKRLNQMPTALGEVFAMMLEKNNPDKDETVLILQCVLFAKRLLTPKEIYFAIIAGTNSQALGRWDPLQVTPDIIRRRIISSSRGLVEIRERNETKCGECGHSPKQNAEYVDILNNLMQIPKGRLKRQYEGLIKSRRADDETVQFIHQSVNDFLVRDRRLQRLDPGLEPNLWAISHDRLKNCCVSYLLMESLEGQNIKEIGSNFPFIEYASRYLFDHAEEATLEGQTELLRTLEDDTIFERIECFHNRFVDYGQDGFSLNLLQILAARDLPKLAVVLINMGADVNAKGIPCGTALEAAIEFEAEQTVKMLLSKGANIDVRGGRDRRTALYRAFKRGNKRILAMLIDKGATLGTLERILKGSLLYHAADTGNKDVVAMVLDKGAKVNALELMGNALCTAANKGHGEIIEMLVEKGAKIHNRGFFSNPLSYAASSGHIEVVKFLYEKGAKINPPGFFGSPLALAASNGHTEVIKFLLEKGAKIHNRGFLGSPLTLAASGGHIEVVKLLLEKEANIQTRGFFGSPLKLAVLGGHIEVIKLLLEKGAKIPNRGLLGSPLQVVVLAGNIEIVKLLLDKEANIQTRGLLGSPLNLAVLVGHREMVKLLLEKGAKINTRGPFGSPLQVAAFKGEKEIVEMLLNNGAEFNARGGLFGNALHGAAMNGNRDVVEMLLEKGANINARWLISPGYILFDDPDNVDKTKIQEMLLEKGIKIGTWGKVYGTALQAAAVKGHEEIVQLLLDKGAKI
ncbi:hypothetical protein Trisim1_005816 [Trichoderma cf. simile WF8]